MPDLPNAEVRALLLACGHGDDEALERQVPMVNAELRRIARRHMGHEVGHPLQPTALVNEAYLEKVPDIVLFDQTAGSMRSETGNRR
jgi:hypothetical protein